MRGSHQGRLTRRVLRGRLILTYTSKRLDMIIEKADTTGVAVSELPEVGKSINQLSSLLITTGDRLVEFLLFMRNRTG